EQEVVEEERDDAHDEAGGRRNQRFPDSAGEDARVHVALEVLNLLECADHTRDRAKKAQHRRDAGNAGQQIRPFLQLEGLMLSLSLYSILDLGDGAPKALQAMSKDACDRLVLRLAEAHRATNIARLHVVADALRDRLRIRLRAPDRHHPLDENVDGKYREDEDGYHDPSPEQYRIEQTHLFRRAGLVERRQRVGRQRHLLQQHKDHGLLDVPNPLIEITLKSGRRRKLRSLEPMDPGIGRQFAPGQLVSSRDGLLEGLELSDAYAKARGTILRRKYPRTKTLLGESLRDLVSGIPAPIRKHDQRESAGSLIDTVRTS